jgi:hypothetical protein
MTRSSALVRAMDAAYLRMKENGKAREVLLNYWVERRHGVIGIDVWTYYLQEDGIEESYPYPERANLPSNTLLARVLDTGVVYICEFLRDDLAFPDEDTYWPVRNYTYAAQLQNVIWETVSEHYAVNISVKWVYSSPTGGSFAHFDNLRRGRDDGGCDVDAAPGAIGGIHEGLPRTTGPLGQFASTVPISATEFSIVVSDESYYSTFDDILFDIPNLSVCFGSHNDGITNTYFRRSTLVGILDYLNNVKVVCESMVLNDTSGKTIYFSDMESTDTVEKKEGLKTISTGIIAPIGHYSTFDPLPPAAELSKLEQWCAELCTSISGVSNLDQWCKDNCMSPGIIKPDPLQTTVGDASTTNHSNGMSTVGSIGITMAFLVVAVIVGVAVKRSASRRQEPSRSSQLLDPVLHESGGSEEFMVQSYEMGESSPVQSASV